MAALGLLATLGIFKLLCHPFEIYNQYNEILPLISNFILEIIVFFLSGALWASVGLLCSSLKKNRYLAYTTPFIFFFTLCFLQENYFQRFYLLNPKNYMIFQSGCLIAGKDAVVLLVLYVASVLLIFYMLISKELHDKNLQKSIIVRKFVHSQTEKRNNRIEKKRKVYAGCNKFLQVIAVVKYNFIMWHNNVRVFFTCSILLLLSNQKGSSE